MKDLVFGRAIRIAALACAAAIAVTGPAFAQQKFLMKFGTATPRGDQNVWMEKFKQRVEKRANGRIEIKLFPSNQLGSVTRQIEGMQLGTVEAWIGPSSFLTGVDPRFQVVDAPGLFDNWAHAQRALTDPEFRMYYLSLGEAKGIKGIGIYVSNPMGVVSRKGPIHKAKDFEGLKLRVLGSQMEIETLRRLGAAGVPMDLSEALPALQQGAIDGVRSGIVVFVPFKYWTISKYLTEVGDSFINVVAIVSNVWWKTLPKDLQMIMLEEAQKLDSEQYAYSIDQQKRFRKIWISNGGEIFDLTGAEHAKLLKIVRPAGEDVVRANPAIKDAYQHLVATAERTRR